MEGGCPRRRGDHHGGGWLPASGRAPKVQQPRREGRKKIEIQDAREIICKVGAERTAELCFSTPPSEPDVPLSGHPALQGLAFPSVIDIHFIGVADIR
jgi:hypothetical protein